MVATTGESLSDYLGLDEEPCKSIRIIQSGDRISFTPDEALLRRAVVNARFAFSALALVSLFVAMWFPVALLLTFIAAFCAWKLPMRIMAHEMVAIDSSRNVILVTQKGINPGTEISVDYIASLRGVYETQGWDSRSVVMAAMSSGGDVPIVFLTGTDEAEAEYVCHALGRILDKPASYTGPFGEKKCCYPVQSS